MAQLEILLQNISYVEREEALQYYNDYFDDAGAENEQSVIEALGNPARVAENIRREFLENQGARSVTAADRAVIEYGKTDIDEQSGNLPVGASATRENGDAAGRSTGFNGSAGFGGSAGSGGSPGSGGAPGAGGKGGRSGGMTVLMAILILFASPFILGLLGMMFGLLMMWLALILCFGVVVLCMFIALFVLLIVGGMCIPADPLVGMAVIGGALVCGGVGILFLMLTVAMAGMVTPAIFRGIGHLFHIKRKEAAA